MEREGENTKCDTAMETRGVKQTGRDTTTSDYNTELHVATYLQSPR